MMISTIKNNKYVKGFLTAIFWLAIWQFLSLAIDNEILLPSVFKTAAALFKMVQQSEFWLDCMSSMLRIVTGFLFGVVLGIFLAVATSFVPVINTLVSPIIKIIRAVPVASFIILALAWFSTTVLPIFISLLMVMPLVWSATSDAIQSVDKKIIEMSELFRFGIADKIFKIYMPFCLSKVASSSLTALGFAWKSSVAAEVICRPIHSLGGSMYTSKLYLEMNECFAITFTIVVLSLVLERVIRTLIRKVGRYDI